MPSRQREGLGGAVGADDIRLARDQRPHPYAWGRVSHLVPGVVMQIGEQLVGAGLQHHQALAGQIRRGADVPACPG